MLIHLVDHYDSRSDPVTKLIHLTVHCFEMLWNLEFWTEPSKLARGIPLHHTLPTNTLILDSSEQGWGELWTPHDLWNLNERADSHRFQLFRESSSIPRLKEIPEYAVWPA